MPTVPTGGTGIGGGENSDGATVVIKGGSLTAWAGEDAGDKNGCVIGAEDGDGHRGSLRIDDNMMVHAGQNPSDADNHLFSSGERVAACYYRPYMRVEVCNHQGSTYTVSGTTDEDTHTLNCSHCLLRTTETHTFVSGKCTVCGVENSICTVSIYLPEAVGGHYTDGHYSATPRVEKVVKGSTITVPSPNVSYLPNGVYFGGWHVGTPDEVKSELGLETMTYWKQENETVVEPGASYTVDGDMNITARYVGIRFLLHDGENNSDMLLTFDNKIAQRITLSGRTLYKNTPVRDKRV